MALNPYICTMALTISDKNVVYRLNTEYDNRSRRNTRLLSKDLRGIDNTADRVRDSLHDATDVKYSGKAKGALNELNKDLKKTGGFAQAVKSHLFALFAFDIGSSLINGLKQVGAQTVQLAIDFEQTNVAFETFLGSAEIAGRVLQELQDFSVVTPFEPDEIISTGRQLLALGIATDKLIPTLESLGNVASGTNTPLNELAFVFGQIRTQQTAYTQDLNQFAARGIPIYDLLAEQLNTNAAGVKKLASQSKIGFEEIELAFLAMTEEGGRFFGLMEKQSQTVGGRISTLKGNFALLQREIGEKLLPTVSKGVDLLNKLVTSLDADAIVRFTKLVAVLVTGFLGYRAGLLAVTVATKGMTFATKAAAAAMRILSVVTKASPVGVFVGILAAATTGLLLFKNEFKEANREMSETERLTKRVGEETAKLTARLDADFVALKRTTEGTKERKEAIDRINESYGEYLPFLLTEKSSLEDIEKAQKGANVALLNSVFLKLKEEEISKAAAQLAERTRVAQIAEQEARKKFNEEEIELVERLVSLYDEANSAKPEDLDGILVQIQAVNDALSARPQLSPLVSALNQRGAAQSEFLRIQNEINSFFDGLMVEMPTTPTVRGNGGKTKKEIEKELKELALKAQVQIDFSGEVDAAIKSLEELQDEINEGTGLGLDSEIGGSNETQLTALDIMFSAQIRRIKQHRNERLAESKGSAKEREQIAKETSQKILETEIAHLMARSKLLEELGGVEYNNVLSEISDKQAQLFGMINKEVETSEMTWGDWATQVGQAAQTAISSIRDVMANMQAQNDFEISLQEERVRRLNENYKEGSAEQLQIEEERLSSLEQRRARFVQNERRLATIQIAIQNAVTIANTAASITKESLKNPLFGLAAAVTIAAALVAGTIAVSNAFSGVPSFFDGVDYFSPEGNQQSDTHGRYGHARIHEGERIFGLEESAAIRQAYGNVTNKELVDRLLSSQMTIAPAYIRPDLVQSALLMGSRVSETEGLKQELKGMRKDMNKLMSYLIAQNPDLYMDGGKMNTALKKHEALKARNKKRLGR